MDKKVIFAVAGSGKTTYIIDKLDLEKRSILITYTINNTETLKRKIVEKFGYFPKNITVYSYFSFLYSFCYKPFFSYKIREKGITYNLQSVYKYAKRKTRSHYLNKSAWLYSHRLSKLLIDYEAVTNINDRLYKYFDNLFIDEVQDFSANDFNFLNEMSKANINILFVGDFNQHTFDTGRDGNLRANLYKDYLKYKKEFSTMKTTIDETSLVTSHRCTKTICDFVNKKIGINIESNKSTLSTIELVEDDEEIKIIVNNDDIMKLFYQKHSQYNCYSNNWGKSKGQEYKDICVVLNDATFKKYQEDKLIDLQPTTKNKFYVACTRATNNIYFIEEKKLLSYKKCQT